MKPFILMFTEINVLDICVDSLSNLKFQKLGVVYKNNWLLVQFPT